LPLGACMHAVVDEAMSQRAAAKALTLELERLRADAQALLTQHPPGPPWLPEGCEDAPPEILAQIAPMVAGAGKFPTDAAVERLWDEMAANAQSTDQESKQGVFGWSLSRLQALAPSFQQITAADRIDTWTVEHLKRWQAVRAALSRGLWTAVLEDEADYLEVYATHLTNDDYVLGAEVLAASLQAMETTRPLVALIADGVSLQGRAALENAGWTLVEVGLVGHEEVDTPQARGFFSKIWLWALPFSRVIYIDTDVLVLDNLDKLFLTSEDAYLAAAPDSQPLMDGVFISQTGFMLVRPSLELFSELWLLCSGGRRPRKLDDWRQFEQGFFTIYFDGGTELDGFGGGCNLGWQRLSPKFNFTVRYCLRTCFAGLGPATASVVHFACAKPWDAQQKDHAPAPYVGLYLRFAQASGVCWRPVNCSADRARERVNQEKLLKMQAAQGMSG